MLRSAVERLSNEQSRRRRGFRRLSVNLLLATLMTLNISTGVYVGAQLMDFIVTSVGASSAIAAQIFSPTYTGYPSLARDYDLEIFASALTLVVNVSRCSNNPEYL